MKAVPEYDLHGRGMLIDDATSELDRLISRARNGGARVFAVVTGYGSTGGTSRIKSAVLAACRKYKSRTTSAGSWTANTPATSSRSSSFRSPTAASSPTTTSAVPIRASSSSRCKIV